MAQVWRVLRRGVAAVALMTLGAALGFPTALLRRRPPTSYAASLRQPTHDDTPPEET